jgi:hypothetical protein
LTLGLRDDDLQRLLLTSAGEGPPLRVGVMVDGFECPAFAVRVLQQVRAASFAELALVVMNCEPHAHPAVPASRSLVTRVRDRLGRRELRRRLLFDLYTRLDQRLHGAGVDDPEREVDCRNLLASIDRLDVVPLRSGFTHRFEESDLAAIRAAKLDVLLRFGFNILKGAILTAARYGIWSFHHGDNEFYRGGPACFWELWEANPLTGVVLQVLTEQLDDGLVLCKGMYPTRLGVSWVLNRLEPYWGSVDFVLLGLRQLHEQGWPALERKAIPRRPYRGRRRLYRAPTNSQMLRWLGPGLARKAVRRATIGPRTAHWQLAVRRRPEPLKLDAPAAPAEFEWMHAPPGRFWADPFVIEAAGARWLFFEDFDYARGKAIISCREILPTGFGPVRACIERDYHLSYPHVFHHDGEIFMIPESQMAGVVQLFKAEEFPDVWRLEKVLFKGNCVDTTPWLDGKTVHFFTTLLEPTTEAIRLELFRADSLTDEWRLHPGSPVSLDVRNARCAGAMFMQDGRWYRPSQDSSIRYGYSFTINEVQLLDHERYAERPVLRVHPEPFGRAAVHTYARGPGVECIDGCVYVRTPR